MKRCSACGNTYKDHVDFCFVDGEVLQGADASAEPVPGTATAPIRLPLPEVVPVMRSSSGWSPGSDHTDAPAPPPPREPEPAAAPAAEGDGEVVRTRTPEAPAPQSTNPPVIERVDVARTPTEFARAGDGPTPLEVPRHVVRIEPAAGDEDDWSDEPVLTRPLVLLGASLLVLAAALAFLFWAYRDGQERGAAPEPVIVTGSPGPFITDPPGAYVFLVGGWSDGKAVRGPRYVGKTAWNGARFSLPPAEEYVFRVVLEGLCEQDVVWSGVNDGREVRVTLDEPPCPDGSAPAGPQGDPGVGGDPSETGEPAPGEPEAPAAP